MASDSFLDFSHWQYSVHSELVIVHTCPQLARLSSRVHHALEGKVASLRLSMSHDVSGTMFDMHNREAYTMVYQWLMLLHLPANSWL